MFTIHVVPVGLSIQNDDSLSLLNLIDAKSDVRKLLSNTVREGLLNLDELDPKISLEITELQNNPEVCAEWSSIYIETRDSEEREKDAYVFIASDTPSGLRAAVFVAAKYAEGKPINYIDGEEDNSGSLSSIQPGQVYICRVSRLDLSQELSKEIFFQLGKMGSEIETSVRNNIGKEGEGQIVFHLGGGFKAMMPFFITIAEGIKTMLDEHRDWKITAQVIHESGLNKTSLDLSKRVLIPIRSFVNLAEDMKKLSEVTVRNGTIDMPEDYNTRNNKLLGLCWQEGPPKRISDLGIILLSIV
ncbi:MAG: hypothetical protein ACRCSF_03015 [Mycobacteriaceae bacterium]